jgi:hypothetical protein
MEFPFSGLEMKTHSYLSLTSTFAKLKNIILDFGINSLAMGHFSNSQEPKQITGTCYY